MKTVTLVIGNSDDQLSQKDWSAFFHEIDGWLRDDGAEEIHFSASSAGASPWQNACWVFTVNETELDGVLGEIRWIRTKWRQDSAAVVVGETLFL
jgi:hypothetical protein